jgi:hypothetical protein
MTINFLLKFTTIGDTPAYNVLYRTPLYALKYLFEYFVRKYLCKVHIRKIVKDLAMYNELKDLFVDTLGMSMSTDYKFCYLEVDVPEEVREQTDDVQLMTYAESVFIEYSRALQKDSMFNTKYLLNTFVTIGLVKTNKTPFIIFDNANFVKFVAISSNIYKIIAYSILQLIILTIITILIF